MKDNIDQIAVNMEEMAIMAMGALTAVLSCMCKMRDAGMADSWESPGPEVYDALYNVIESIPPQQRGSVVLALLVSVGTYYAETVARNAVTSEDEKLLESVNWRT